MIENSSTSATYSRFQGTLVDPSQMAGLRVAVVGAGALGAELFRILALSGTGDILLIDPDRVYPENLAQSTIFSRDHIELSKVGVLAAYAAARFPSIQVAAMAMDVADVGWGHFEGRHIIFGAVDRDSARLVIARIATRLGLLVCDGGLGGHQASIGRATLFPVRSDTCFSCRLTSVRRGELLSSWSGRAFPCKDVAEESGRPTTPVIAALTASLMIDTAVREVREPSVLARSIEFRFDASPSVETMSISQSSGCPFHGIRLPMRRIEGPFANVLKEGMQIRWEWPICTKARCADCGISWAPLVRVAKLRDSHRCPECSSRMVIPVAAINGVMCGSPLTSMTPTQLGLPPDHRFLISNRSGEYL